jgi:hypothetical protein
MTGKHQINAEWAAIRGYLADVDDRDIGRDFKEYLEENMSDNWDLFTSQDVGSIRRILTDFLLYINDPHRVLKEK